MGSGYGVGVMIDEGYQQKFVLMNQAYLWESKRSFKFGMEDK